jgi:mono/diheme cytochrome c family protein
MHRGELRTAGWPALDGILCGYILSIVAVLAASAGSAFAAADAQRGAAVVQRERCLGCHSIRGEGGNTAPDLGRRFAHSYTPATLAAEMWNHAPRMWAAIEQANMPLPRLTEADADDLFAYLYSVRYFDRPGDAGRGKELFTEKHCSGCHSLTEPSHGPGDPVSSWMSLKDPVALVEDMWNHASVMQRAVQQKEHQWVMLTGQDLTDLTVYLQNLPSQRGEKASFTLPDPASGREPFEKNCAQCHTGSLSLDKRLSGMTLTDVAAAMWNHVPRMLTVPTVGTDDMHKIVAYVWEKQYLGPSGNAGKGRKVFQDKHCASCHDDPTFTQAHFMRGGKVFTPLSMVSVLWLHGPQMLEQMKKRGVTWPRLSPEDISNLVSYLNTRP